MELPPWSLLMHRVRKLRIIVIGPVLWGDHYNRMEYSVLDMNDPGVLKEFYSEHFPSVRTYVLQNSGSAQDAQDVFQEALVATWLNAKQGKLQPESNLGGYVFRIAKNKWLDRVRSAAYKNEIRVEVERQDHTDNGVDQEARIEHLQHIYAQLDGRCKQILDRFYYEKKDLATIAEELGVDINSMRTIKYRCMMKLRKLHGSKGTSLPQKEE